MKKNLAMFLVGLSLSTGVVSASEINLIINSNVTTASESPVQQSGTTLVPVRIVSEQLGASVDWNASTQQITITKDNTQVELQVGSTTAKVNGQASTLTTAPIVKNGTTMIPLRFVSEALNVPVLWDDGTSTVLINSSLDDLSKLPTGITPSQALEQIKLHFSSNGTYTYQGLGSSNYHIYGESMANFYEFFGEFEGGVYVHKTTGRVYGILPGGVVEYTSIANYQPTYYNISGGISPEVAIEILQQKHSIYEEYRYNGYLGSDYTLNGESGANFYSILPSMSEGTFYVNKNTGQAFFSGPGGVSSVDNIVEKQAEWDPSWSVKADSYWDDINGDPGWSVKADSYWDDFN
ncbi:MAG: hypothetical protein ATN35_02615 [Epulopiscium sp. Nele67-Bin004]|nr:MAG: hypothetical protein ATN35_02615 [Epulopiscium sp. Nele67-Bin004]